MSSENSNRNDRPVGLTCRACGTEYAATADVPWRCRCGHALDFAELPLPAGDRPTFRELETRRGLWAFEEFIPIERHTSFGEGFTPLVDVPEFGVECKLEYVFPTGSFKDRGATTIVSRAVELGVDTVVDDSSGNAGSAIATYAARAGIDAEIYVPAGVKASKRETIERVGATVIEVPGSRSDVTSACLDAVGETRPDSADLNGHDTRQNGDAWYASHAWSPAFYAGTMTAALEIAAQRDWNVPDAIVSPIGHGTLFLGLYRGFERLLRAGWIDRVPKLFGVQAAGYAPIADRFHDRSARRNSLADGIQIRRPARERQLVAAIEATDGDAIAVTESAVERALERLHRNGFYVEPTSASVLAALERYRTMGKLDPDDDVVLPLTGSGLKGA
ncbi:threonine synthase [Natrinema sp. CBA1119]|uniref:threonine synthase n=1 Tax=Natrinema sp. CBA1119 TaxID=1608465 RepID=UPI000BF3AE7F|nr:threonine synthase [Natrinema sp. CBA1119]PGF14280.1 threonine synthase [Natrinema sp. CBA1119]